MTNAEGQAFCIDCHSYFTLPTIPLKQVQAEAARLHQSKIKAALRDALGMLDILWKGDDIVPLREIEAFCEEIRELLIDGYGIHLDRPESGSQDAHSGGEDA